MRMLQSLNGKLSPVFKDMETTGNKFSIL